MKKHLAQPRTISLEVLRIALRLLLVSFVIFPGFAYGEFMHEIRDGTVTITGYRGNGGTLIIPEKINGFPVVAIGDSAFNGNTNLSSITVSSGVTIVGFQAFSSCSSLTNVVIAGSITNWLYGRLDQRFGSFAFFDCTNLITVELGEGTSHIESCAFAKCTSLRSIVIPKSVTLIREFAFDGCSSLEQINIPQGVESIGVAAFGACISLTNVTFPSSVVTLQLPVFYSCFSLRAIHVDPNNPAYSSVDGVLFNKERTSLLQYPQGKLGEDYVIQDGTTNIAARAFYACGTLTRVLIPESVVEIGYAAFYECTNLSAVDIPHSVRNIWGATFYGCASLTNLNLGNGVAKIWQEAFARCSGLKEITIPSSVSYIGSGVFANCQGLTTVTIPDNVTSLGPGTFTNCGNLATINIGSGVTVYLVETFRNCTNLLEITVSDSNPRYSSLDGVLFDKTQPERLRLLRYPQRKPGPYTIPSVVKFVEDEAFLGCSRLTAVTFELGVGIGLRAFSRCGTLAEVTILPRPEVITHLTDSAFSDCPSLTSFTLPEGYASVGIGAFSGCTGLTNIMLPASMGSIRESAFAACSSLTGVTLPGHVYRVERYAFDLCTSLTNISVMPENPNFASLEGVLSDKSQTLLVAYPYGKGPIYTIPGNFTSVGDYAFANCRSLISVGIPDSVTNIGQGAFSGCSGLTSVTLPNSVTSVGDEVFQRCGGLTNVALPDGMVRVPFRAFESCSSLPGVMLPDSVTDIGSFAFKDCTSLAEIAIPEGVTQIGRSAFQACNLHDVTIPASVNRLGPDVFYDCKNLRAVHWEGDAPQLSGLIFNVDGVIGYYVPGAEGWGPTYSGYPTALWKPSVQTSDPGSGTQTNPFCLTIWWARGRTVAVEACTDLTTSAWSAVHTNVITSGYSYFCDGDSTKDRKRFYRVRSQ